MQIFLIQIIILLSITQLDYREIYDYDYKWAVKFIKKNKRLIVRKASEYGSDTAVITSVIFPEVIRYSIFKDYFETKGLELIYVNYGKKYADYSIGYFQMKPSFVEKLEEYVIKTDMLNGKFEHIVRYEYEKDKKIRKERIERLKSLEWQLDYLNCFYIIAYNLHSGENWTNKIEKIKFFATAYNHGFYKETDEIKDWLDVELFPYGAQIKSKQYSYNDISCYYFNNDYGKIFR
jgi:hypothetical protein